MDLSLGNPSQHVVLLRIHCFFLFFVFVFQTVPDVQWYIVEGDTCFLPGDQKTPEKDEAT